MRIPWLLHRSILGDLLRTTILVTTVLVTVIAFGAAVRPLAQNLLGPADLPRFLLLACVPMLQYALPFAAAFATVSVYHRLSVDREVQAMESAGFPMRRIIVPALALGGMLLVAMLALVHFAAPRFWMSMQDLLARDAARLLAAAVEQGEGIQVGELEIYADEALVSPDPPDTGARERLVLAGVAALELGDGDGMPRTEFTAEHAVIDVHQGEAGAILKLVLINATVRRESEQAVAVLPQARPEAIDLGRSLAGDPKGLVLMDLLRARTEPEAFRPMREAAEPLNSALGRLDAWNCVDRALADGGSLEFESSGSGRTIVVGQARRSGASLVPIARGGRIALEERGADRVLRRTDVDRATLRLDEEPREGISFLLEVSAGTEAEELVGGSPRRGRWPQRLGGLHPIGCEPFETPSTVPTLLDHGRSIAARVEGSGDSVKEETGRAIVAAANSLERAHERFQLDVLARQNQRAAQALAGLLLPLLAALVAVRSKASVSLGVFVIVFLPAIADMLLVSSGEQMTRWYRPEAGLATIWGAQGGLLLAIAIAWWSTTRR
jgi:lipopolysaccharide export LptBFGC system permease protein LptF